MPVCVEFIGNPFWLVWQESQTEIYPNCSGRFLYESQQVQAQPGTVAGDPVDGGNILVSGEVGLSSGMDTATFQAATGNIMLGMVIAGIFALILKQLR